MTHSSLLRLQIVSAYWFLLSQVLLAYARQMTMLEYSGARAALRKARQLDEMAQVVMFDAARCRGEAEALSDSEAKDALLRELDLTLFVLVGLRLVAWNIMLARGPRDEWLGAMATNFRNINCVMPAPNIARIAAIDSS